MLKSILRPLVIFSSFNRAMSAAGTQYPIVCSEEIMKPKAHGTTEFPVQSGLRWNCDAKVADNICSFNRHYAEHSGYFVQTSFLSEVCAI